MTPAGLDRQALKGLGLVVGVLVVLVLGLSGTITHFFDANATRQVSAVFADAQQLRAGDGVRIQGVEAGTVRSVRLAPDGRSSTVVMDVDRDAGKLRDDARAILRFKNVLGGSFYVDLERGSDAGQLARAIPLAHTDRQVELDDVVATVQGRARQGLQALPGALADGLADTAAPARVFDSVARAAPSVQGGAHALRGQALDDDLRRLVRHTAGAVRALDQPADDVRRVVAGAAATLDTVAARDADVRTGLHTSPEALAETARTMAQLRMTLALAQPVVSGLRKPAGQLAPTLAQLRPAVIDADHLVQQARPLLDALRPATRSLASTARIGVPFLKDVQPSLTRLDDTILPYINEVDPRTKKSTAVMIGGTFTGLASGAGGQMDEAGRFIRFPATTGSSPSNSLPCQVYIANPDAQQIAACNSLKDSLATLLSYSPLGPTPGATPAAPTPGG